MGFLKPHADKIYAVMRIFVGLLFMQHGLQKIFGLFGGMPPDAPAFIKYGAGGIELVGGALVAIGLFTAPAAFLCSGTMAVAYFMVHAPKGFLPILNGGEPAAVYCWIFLVIAAKGAGIWSVDAARGGQA
jgi:putative oxidoreductase